MQIIRLEYSMLYLERTGSNPHSEHRFPAPSSKLYRFSYATEGALYLRAAVQRRGQRPPKGLGTDKTVEAT